MKNVHLGNHESSFEKVKKKSQFKNPKFINQKTILTFFLGEKLQNISLMTHFYE